MANSFVNILAPQVPGLLLAVVVAMPAAGCGSRCGHEGISYRVGETFPSDDGCNICSCTSSGIACTTRGCNADGGMDATVSTDAAGDAGADAGRDVAADAAADATVDVPAEDARPTADAALDGADDATAACSFDHSYRFRDDGGLRAFADSSTLQPARTHVLARDLFINSLPIECSRDLVCSDPTVVDVAEINAALQHPDVVAALATTPNPFYGTDTRPVDGTVFIFLRDDQRGFTVGSGDVPAGLRALENLLHTLQEQTLASPACANVRARP